MQYYVWQFQAHYRTDSEVELHRAGKYLNKLVEIGAWEKSSFYFTDEFRYSSEERTAVLTNFPRLDGTRPNPFFSFGNDRITLIAPKEQLPKYVEYLRSHNAIRDGTGR